MKKHFSLPVGLVAALAAGTVFSIVFSGCVATDSGHSRGYGRHHSGQAQVAVTYQDDYDYYPGYEVYYSRNRREYVYRDGSSWVRRPQPPGISLDVLLATPSVRVDFHDGPEHHHDRVIQTYPRDWQPPGKAKGHDKNHKDKKHKDEDRRN